MPSRPSLPTFPSAAGGAACQSVRGGLTDEEVAIAREIRALKEEERALRRALREAERDQRPALQARLAALRAQGLELVARREEARHRRMVLLGHEAP